MTDRNTPSIPEQRWEDLRRIPANVYDAELITHSVSLLPPDPSIVIPLGYAVRKALLSIEDPYAFLDPATDVSEVSGLLQTLGQIMPTPQVPKANKFDHLVANRIDARNFSGLFSRSPTKGRVLFVNVTSPSFLSRLDYFLRTRGRHFQVAYTGPKDFNFPRASYVARYNLETLTGTCDIVCSVYDSRGFWSGHFCEEYGMYMKTGGLMAGILFNVKSAREMAVSGAELALISGNHYKVSFGNKTYDEYEMPRDHILNLAPFDVMILDHRRLTALHGLDPYSANGHKLPSFVLAFEVVLLNSTETYIDLTNYAEKKHYVINRPSPVQITDLASLTPEDCWVKEKSDGFPGILYSDNECCYFIQVDNDGNVCSEADYYGNYDFQGYIQVEKVGDRCHFVDYFGPHAAFETRRQMLKDKLPPTFWQNAVLDLYVLPSIQVLADSDGREGIVFQQRFVSSGGGYYAKYRQTIDLDETSYQLRFGSSHKSFELCNINEFYLDGKFMRDRPDRTHPNRPQQIELRETAIPPVLALLSVIYSGDNGADYLDEIGRLYYNDPKRANYALAQKIFQSRPVSIDKIVRFEDKALELGQEEDDPAHDLRAARAKYDSQWGGSSRPPRRVKKFKGKD